MQFVEHNRCDRYSFPILFGAEQSRRGENALRKEEKTKWKRQIKKVLEDENFEDEVVKSALLILVHMLQIRCQAVPISNDGTVD